VLFLLVGSGLAMAQSGYTVGGTYYPYEQAKAATAGESYARGMSDVVRSQGQYNLQTSQAMINLTEAQRRDMENRDQWVDTYFDMREKNRQYRAAERGPRPSREDWVRYAQAGKPQRLSPSELEPVTGGVDWPVLLKAEKYAENRSTLEGLFAKRAHDGGLSTSDYLKIDQVTGVMLAQLRKDIELVPPSDYMASKRFLESLSFEAKQPIN